MLSMSVILTRAWTATYTRGLPRSLRDERRDEIDCDLWEHQHRADFEAESVAGTAVAILLRLLLGIPADISWRLETGSAARTKRGNRMKESTFVKVAVVVGIALSALTFFAGMGNLVLLTGDWDEGSGLFQRVYGLFVTLSGAAVITGLIVGMRKPNLGLGLVAGGSVGTIVLMFWMFMITIPVSIVLVTIAYRRAGKPGWPGGARARPAGTA
jgi:hypothetical protein